MQALMEFEWKIGRRYQFIGEVDSIRREKVPPKSRKKRQGQLHMLLDNVTTVDGIPFRDHLWIPYTKKFKQFQFEKGDLITFWAKVYKYRRFKAKRGYGGRYVYRLEVEEEDDIIWQWGLKNVIGVESVASRDTE